MKLLDRDAERVEIDAFLEDHAPSRVRLLQLDGKSGVGKTDLLRYVLHHASERVFLFEDDVPYHKCRPGDQDQNFAMLSSMIGALAIRRPDEFASATNDKVRKLSVPPFSQIVLNVVSSLPYVQGASSAYKADLDEIAASRTQILRLARNSHVTRALTDFCVASIKEEHHQKSIIFAIDDIDWIDNDSSQVLFSICRRLSKDGYDIGIVATSDSFDTNSPTKNLVEFEKTVRDFPEVRTTFIPVDLLSRDDVTKVLSQLGQDASDDMVGFLFDTTKGNFSDLMRLLRQRDSRIQLLYQNWRNARPEAPSAPALEIWIDRLRELFVDQAELRTAFAIFVTLENTVTWKEFRLLISSPQQTSNASIVLRTDAEIQNLLAPLMDEGDVQVIGEYLVADARLMQAAKTLLLEEGVLNQYAVRFASAFQQEGIQDSLDPTMATERAARLLLESNPKAALEELRKIIPEVRSRAVATPSALKVAAEAFLQLPQSSNESVVAALPFACVLLSQLNKVGEFFVANQLAAELWNHRESLTDEEREELGIDFLQASREAGALEKPGQPSGKEIAAQAEGYARSADAKVRVLMTAASVFEHLNDNAAIQDAFDSADAVVAGEREASIRSKLEREIIRNSGLRKFHGDILDEYERALADVPSIDDADTIADRASHLNHIGLANYHTGRIDDAITVFVEAAKQLEKIGIRQETPLNNLASSMLFQDRLQDALRTFEQARDIPVKPAYQTLSIDNNYAVCLYKLGNVDLAITMLEQIANGQRPAPDPSIPSHANANLGYIFLMQGDYLEAAARYTKSNEHEFRFLMAENSRLRTMMAKYCAAKAGIIQSEDLGDYSFIDLSESQSLPVRRPYQLDLNSLYVL